MATPFATELVTPEQVLFSGQVDEITMRTDEGEIAFLAGHEDYIAAVDITVVRLSVVSGSGGAGGAGGPHGGDEAAGEELRVAVHGGFVEVNSDGVTILASVAELADAIDVERARRALEAAESAEHGGGDATLAAGAEQPADEHGGDERALALSTVSPSPAMLALLEPDAPSVRARRARARLEAAGVS